MASDAIRELYLLGIYFLPALGAGLVKLGIKYLSALELRSLGINGITNINRALKAESSFIKLENTLSISNKLKKAGVMHQNH